MLDESQKEHLTYLTDKLDEYLFDLTSTLEEEVNEQQYNAIRSSIDNLTEQLRVLKESIELS